MLIRVRKLGLPRGSIFLAVVLGIATGIYIWKPVFDPAERHKLAKYEKPKISGAGNECSMYAYTTGRVYFAECGISCTYNLRKF